MELHAVVLLKSILDPEMPRSQFAIDAETKRPATGSVPEVLGPFEQNALEVALQLKDSGAVSKLTAVAAGGESAVDPLRRALAVGADEVVFIDTDKYELDPRQTAAVLAAAIDKIGAVDLVVGGRQAGDWDHGQVGYVLAERLGWPCVAFAQQIVADNGALKVLRQGATGDEWIAVQPSAVVTVTNSQGNSLRMARIQQLMRTRRAPVPEWSLADLGLDTEALQAEAVTEIIDMRRPPARERCEIIEGDDPDAVAAELVRRLRELGALSKGGV